MCSDHNRSHTDGLGMQLHMILRDLAEEADIAAQVSLNAKPHAACPSSCATAGVVVRASSARAVASNNAMESRSSSKAHLPFAHDMILPGRFRSQELTQDGASNVQHRNGQR